MKKAIGFELKNPAWTGFMLSIGVLSAGWIGQEWSDYKARVQVAPTVVYFAPELAWPYCKRWTGGYI